MANVLGYQNFSADCFAGQSCMCCRPVAWAFMSNGSDWRKSRETHERSGAGRPLKFQVSHVVLPANFLKRAGSEFCRGNGLEARTLHLQVLRHHTIASKASLRHPSAHTEATDFQSCPQVVQRTSASSTPKSGSAVIAPFWPVASCEERRACITALQQHLRSRLDSGTFQPGTHGRTTPPHVYRARIGRPCLAAPSQGRDQSCRKTCHAYTSCPRSWAILVLLLAHLAAAAPEESREPRRPAPLHLTRSRRPQVAHAPPSHRGPRPGVIVT